MNCMMDEKLDDAWMDRWMNEWMDGQCYALIVSQPVGRGLCVTWWREDPDADIKEKT